MSRERYNFLPQNFVGSSRWYIAEANCISLWIIADAAVAVELVFVTKMRSFSKSNFSHSVLSSNKQILFSVTLIVRIGASYGFCTTLSLPRIFSSLWIHSFEGVGVVWVWVQLSLSHSHPHPHPDHEWQKRSTSFELQWYQRTDWAARYILFIVIWRMCEIRREEWRSCLFCVSEKMKKEATEEESERRKDNITSIKTDGDQLKSIELFKIIFSSVWKAVNQFVLGNLSLPLASNGGSPPYRRYRFRYCLRSSGPRKILSVSG